MVLKGKKGENAMNGANLYKSLAMLTLACVLLLLVAQTVDAAKGSVGGDKDMASRKGLELGSKKLDQSKMPSKLEMAMGIGSIFVMIAVLKWL